MRELAEISLEKCSFYQIIGDFSGLFNILVFDVFDNTQRIYDTNGIVQPTVQTAFSF